MTVRYRHIFQGMVQGEGFRPTACTLAASMRLTGFVRCAGAEVVVEVQGEVLPARDFPRTLTGALPSGASVDAIRSLRIPPTRRESAFRIMDGDGTP